MDVPFIHRFLGGFARQQEDLLFWLADIETRHLQPRLTEMKVDRPIYVCGLARSGSTILLETLAAHADTGTYRYMDYPFPMIPYFWSRFTRQHAADSTAQERSHGDGLQVTPQSPEAIEEMLWMHFMPNSHNPDHDNTLSADTEQTDFKAFYTNTIRKLLLARDAPRYLAKNNYNIIRLPFLLSCFPDARFVVPVRDPVWHIASLMKQHKLLSEQAAGDSSAVAYMRHVGHFEFGGDMRPLNLGDREHTAHLQSLWQKGRDVEAWAEYWAAIHRHLLEDLSGHAAVASATLIVDYDGLCAHPLDALQRLNSHVALGWSDEDLNALNQRFRAPGYYKPEFSGEELAMIKEKTGTIFSALQNHAG